jgi:CheY-like chemotaxis protein
MNILLLEDVKHRITFFKNGLKQHKLTVCSHVRAAKKALKATEFDIIFLDYDLQGIPADPESENCGSEIARYIVDHKIDCSCIILHTESMAGREAMETLLEQSHSIPYGKLKKMSLHAVLKLVVDSEK